MSYVLDVLATLIHSLVWSGIAMALEKVDPVRAIVLAAAGFVWTVLFLIAWFVLARGGQTIGKWLGLQVVGADGTTPVGVLCMLLRSTVKAFVASVLVLDPILVLLDQERRRSTGDRLLDCRVVEVESTGQG